MTTQAIRAGAGAIAQALDTRRTTPRPGARNVKPYRVIVAGGVAPIGWCDVDEIVWLTDAQALTPQKNGRILPKDVPAAVVRHRAPGPEGTRGHTNRFDRPAGLRSPLAAVQGG